MAGSARFTAILDACVLYPATLRDLLLSLARDRLHHARWSERIQDEWVRSLLKRRPDLEEAALRHRRSSTCRWPRRCSGPSTAQKT